VIRKHLKIFAIKMCNWARFRVDRAIPLPTILLHEY
jgi:hypothetical protein